MKQGQDFVIVRSKQNSVLYFFIFLGYLSNGNKDTMTCQLQRNSYHI
jgi:hypothetical protein